MNLQSTRQLTPRELLWAGLFSLLVVDLLAGQALSASFHIIDDHEILRYIMTPTNVVDVLNQDFAGGRSRSLYYVLRLAQVALLGGNPALWHLMMLGIGVLTLIILYAAARQFIRPLFAITVIALLVLHPYAPLVWVRLGPQEGLGTLPLWGMAKAVRGQQWGDAVFVGCLVAAGFYKESFALFTPALIGFRVLIQILTQRSWRRLAPWLVILIAINLIQLALIVFAALQPNSYGGTQVANSASRLQPFIQLVARAVGFIPVLGAVVVTWPKQRLMSLGAVGLLFMAIVPQAYLYGELMSERYWFPAIVATSLSVGLALEVLARLAAVAPDRRLRRVTWLNVCALLTVATVVIAMPNIPRQILGTQTFTAQTEAVHRAVETALRSEKRVIAVRIAPMNLIEQALSMPYHLRFAGFTGEIVLLPINPPLTSWIKIYQSAYDRIGAVGQAPDPSWYVLEYLGP